MRPAAVTLSADQELNTLRARIAKLEEDESRSAETEHLLQNALHELAVSQEQLRTQNEHLRRTQEELEESQQRYVDLFEYAPVGYLFLDRDGCIEHINLRGADMLHHARRELVGQRMTTYLQRSSHGVLSQHLNATFRRGSATAEVNVRCADGSVFPATLQSVLVSSEEVPARYCRTALLDVSERRETEAALRESEERFRNLIEGSIQGICIHRDWKPLFVNQAYADLFGFDTPEAILSMDSLVPLIAPHERERLQGYFLSRIEGKETPAHYEYEAVRKDGTMMTLDKVVRAVNWQGQPASQHTVVDITERKRAEERDRQHRAELAHMARLSTMGEMATTLAHELNQPLTAIVSYTEGSARRIRSDGAISPAISEALTQTALLAKRAAGIVRRIRGFVRKQDAKREFVNVNAIIDDAVQLVAAEARQKTISIIRDFIPKPPPVEGDFIQLEQVVLNLIRNGMDAMEKQADTERRLYLRTDRKGDDEVELVVEDTGTGLPDEMISSVYEPFVTTKPEGLGLGLSISRTIVETHGGRIWAKPGPVRGTSFHVALPVANTVGE